MRLLANHRVYGILLIVCLAACTAPTQRPESAARTANEPAQTSQSGNPSTGPKRIVTAVVGQPDVWVERLRTGPRVGSWNLYELTSAGMTLVDAQGDLQPQLAQTVPTLENNLWKVFSDGRMETTWKLKPNLKWHDGRPVTSADFVFTALIDQDTGIPFLRAAPYSNVDVVEAPDPQTVIVHWKRPHIDADQLFTRNFSSVVAKHVLETVYATDKTRIENEPYWGAEYVGAGPYKVQSFDRSGGPIILQAFDDYVLGRPRIDEIEIRPFAASDALMVSVLAGGIDVTLGSPGLSLDQGVQLTSQWQGGRVEYTPGNWLSIYPQLLTPNPPIVGDVRFRKALMHAMDRQSMAETLSYGLESVAHSFMNPNQPQYRAIEGRIIKYDYDPRKAAAMIEGLGYTKGPDGIYRTAGGQSLSVEARAQPGTPLPFLPVVAGQWRDLGIGVEEHVIPGQRVRDPEYRATFPAFEVLSLPNDLGGLPLLHSRYNRLPENNWTGNNWSRMTNPQFDALLDRWQATVPVAERMQVLGQILYDISDVLNVMPLTYGVRPIALSTRMQGVAVGSSAEVGQSWNVQTWDVR